MSDKLNYLPTRIVADEKIVDNRFARAILARAEQLEIPLINKTLDQPLDSEAGSARKTRCLHLSDRKRSYLKGWSHGETTPDRDEICLIPIEGCLFDCCYCYLQDYLNDLNLVATVNHAQLKAQIVQAIAGGGNFFSFGELSDGLQLEFLLKYLPEIWECFADNRTVELEIRTKSQLVSTVLGELEPLNNVTFTWTITPASQARRLELYAPKPELRLKALKKLQAAGFSCGIRFDPLVLCDGWWEDFRGLLVRVEKIIDLKKLSSVKLGTFRFPAGLDLKIISRFPGRSFIRDEFVRGPDGKYRYPKPRRIAAYKKLKKLLSSRGVNPQLCMEPDYIWRGAGYSLPAG